MDDELLRRSDAPSILTKKKIRELVEQIDPMEKLEPEVESVIWMTSFL
jgi:transcription initiation factor TFIID subunit TAF12